MDNFTDIPGLTGWRIETQLSFQISESSIHTMVATELVGLEVVTMGSKLKVCYF